MSTLVGRGRSIVRRVRHRGRDLLLDARLVAGRRTSIGDARPFPALCARAAVDPATFATFRRSPEFRVVIENLRCEHGRGYLERALEQTPALAGLLDRFRENDRLGSPVTCDYGAYGHFSPATLRYVRVLSDLLTLFGPLDGRRIVEIGGGYGGQCFVTSVAAAPASYALVDLDRVLDLQRRYLRELDVPNVAFVSADELDPRANYDLVVSNYAFSECVRRVQRHYAERVLARARRGYITCNWLRPRLTMTREELLAAVPGSRFVPDVPVIVPGTAILVWGER